MQGNGFGPKHRANGNGKNPGLPSFFIIGPPRTGTTWLHMVLSQCAWLPHPTKETRFFDKHFDRGLSWYGWQYRGASQGRIIGEVAPTYFASSTARERIARLVPHARIVCTFRNPVDRILSLYRLKRAYGLIPWPFDEALERDPELLDSSRYAAHLKAWKRALGDSQVMATVHDDIQTDPQTYLDAVTDFVGIPRLKLAASQTRRVLTSEDLTEPRHYHWTHGAILMAEWAKKKRLDAIVSAAKRLGGMKFFVGGGRAFVELTASQRAKLHAIFRPEIDELAAMLNRDLSAWM